MASEIKNVLLLGAGGNLGPPVLNAFLKHSKFNITVLSRPDSKSTFPPGVKVVRADYSSIESLTTAFKGQDAVVSLVGSPALNDQPRLIDAAIAAGVKRFIPSEYGANTPSERLREILPLFNTKKEVVDYLKSKEDHITWSGLITGAFFDWGFIHGFLGFDAASKTVKLLDEGKGPFSSTTVHQIGLALIKVLENAELTKNQYVYVSSFQTSQAELLPIVEKVTGSKFNVNNVSSKELILQGSEKLKKQDYSGIGDVIRGISLGDEGLGDYSPEGLWNERLGLQKEDLEETVRLAVSGKLVGQE